MQTIGGAAVQAAAGLVRDKQCGPATLDSDGAVELQDLLAPLCTTLATKTNSLTKIVNAGFDFITRDIARIPATKRLLLVSSSRRLVFSSSRQRTRS